MPIENWSSDVVIVRLGDDPLYSEELAILRQDLVRTGGAVVLDFTSVTYLNSTQLSLLLVLRRHLVEREGRLVLCGIDARTWGTFLVTGLDRVFTFCDDVSTSLAALQMKDQGPSRIEDLT